MAFVCHSQLILIFASCPRSRRNRPRRNIFIRDIWQHLVLILVRPQRLDLVQAGGDVAHQVAHDHELIICDAGRLGIDVAGEVVGESGEDSKVLLDNLHVFALQETLEGESR